MKIIQFCMNAERNHLMMVCIYTDGARSFYFILQKEVIKSFVT